MNRLGFFTGILLLLLLAISTKATAQIASSSISPDFTTMDLIGNSINLYNELDQGRTVIVNVFAAWSPIAWDYHEQGALQALHQMYGPLGNNTISVLMIEGEVANQNEQISGTGTTGLLFSTGDWTAGTDFPICDDSNAASILQVSYYPTIYMICPDRRIIEIGAIGQEEIISILEQQSCSPSLISNDAELVSVNKISGNCVSPDYVFEAIIQNKGFETLTAATIFADDLLEYNWTGSLEKYAFDTITIGTLNLPVGDTLAFVLTSTNDQISANDTIEKFVGTVAASTHIRVQVRTDNWPAETSWTIKDENGNIVAQSGSFATMNNQAITEDVFVQSTGCFSFTLFDSGNDGLNGTQWGGIDGYCKVYGVNSEDQLIRYIYNYDGNYNLIEETSDFLVNEIVGIQETINMGRLSVYPNPSSDLLNVTYSLQNAGNLKFELYNSVGSRVFSSQTGVQPAGNYVQPIETNQLSSGFYLLKISNGSGIVPTLRISVVH